MAREGQGTMCTARGPASWNAFSIMTGVGEGEANGKRQTAVREQSTTECERKTWSECYTDLDAALFWF